jgi:AbrB family looped-hinge helix DNA binding protein
MKTTIDKAGRVVIPAAIRAKAGFKARMELEIILEDDGIRLVPRIPGPQLVQVGKRLVARPTANPEDRTPVDIAKLIEEERDRWPW